MEWNGMTTPTQHTLTTDTYYVYHLQPAVVFKKTGSIRSNSPRETTIIIWSGLPRNTQDCLGLPSMVIKRSVIDLHWLHGFESELEGH